MTIDEGMLIGTAIAAGILGAVPVASAQVDQSILKVGYALAMTGPNAGGAFPLFRNRFSEASTHGELGSIRDEVCDDLERHVALADVEFDNEGSIMVGMSPRGIAGVDDLQVPKQPWPTQ